jgi:hypothetical protein
MLISLDVVTRKKLILVKQIYQRALIQSQAKNSYVDRIFAVVGFDLANETVLKAVVSSLNPSKNLANDFQGVLSQAETELTAKSVTIPDKVKIQHVRTLRNDAQHKAKYPNESDVNDCRTYTRDFLTQTFFDVWGESFESISLVDIIQDATAKNLLAEAEQSFIKGDYRETVVKSMVAFKTMIGGFADSITEHISSWVKGIVITESFKEAKSSEDMLRAFMRTRELVAFQTIGISSQEYLKYKRFTRFIRISIAQAGNYTVNFSSQNAPTKEEAEYVFNFVTKAIVLVESLDEDVTKAYNRLR